MAHSARHRQGLISPLLNSTCAASKEILRFAISQELSALADSRKLIDLEQWKQSSWEIRKTIGLPHPPARMQSHQLNCSSRAPRRYGPHR